MAGSGVTLYSVTSAGNKTVIGTIDWREDVYMPSQINDNLGQIMADIRAMANAVATGWIEIGDGDGTYTATYVSATSFRFDGVNVTSYYRVGMRVRVVAPTPGTLSGTITSSAFSTHTTLTVAWDSGSLSNEAITSVSLGIGSGGGSGAAASYRNILGRNGGLEVWQRGAGGAASFGITASAPQYTADGWWFVNGANQGSLVSQGNPLTNGSRYAATFQRSPGQTGITPMSVEYPLDADEIPPLRNSIVTLSLTLQAGANWSPAGGILEVFLICGTGAPARLGGGYTGQNQPIGTTQALTTTATRYSFTSAAVVPTATTQATVYLRWTPVGTAGATDYFVIDDVQLEIGSAATPFERRPFEQELLACQRHYWKSFAYATAPAQAAGFSHTVSFAQFVAAGVSQETASVVFPVDMRVTPTLTGYNPNAANNQACNEYTLANCSSTTFFAASWGIRRTVLVTAVGSAVGHVNTINITADAGI